MTSLTLTPTAELRAELARREADGELRPPEPKPTIDWSPVLKMAIDYRDWCDGDDYHEDNDWRYYLYEAVIEAVFGDAFWVWKRKRRP